MSGGYRYGAGRPGWRGKCELSLPLDIRRLHRKGLLRPGSSFTWQWTRDGEPRGHIGLRVTPDGVQLSYTRRQEGEELQPRRYIVPIERTPCHFGGARSWFRCPGCHRRCAILYGLSGDGYFACRLCLRLAYLSESEDTCGRLWRKQGKLEARLGEEGERPKGMRRQTYECLLARLSAIEDARDRVLDLRLGAIAHG